MIASLSALFRSHPRLATWSRIGAPVVLLPVVLFVVVRPDWFYVQNGLDPFFYTGYVQSFDNIFHAVGDGHYFISRWSIFLPQRALLWLLGDPKAAFLVMRWVGASTIVGATMLLGSGRWRRGDAVALSALVLLMPMAIRGLMTDYSDAVAFPLGVALIVVLARWPERWQAAAIVGVFAGLMVVANPFAATVVAAAVPFWLLRVAPRRWPALLAVAAAGGVAVLVFGWLLFRLRYGIPNVYAPTLDFIREQGTPRDPLKSPRLVWLRYRLWIYLPPLLVGLYQVLKRWGGVTFDATADFVVRTCALQYALQVWYQFSRNGSTLEISYYWSYILPSFVLTFCVVLGGIARPSSSRTLPIVAAATVLLTALVGERSPELVPWWGVGVVVAVALVAAGWRFGGRRPVGVLVAVVLVVFAIQAGSPRPEPILADELRVLSSYELTYDSSSDGVQSFEIVSWFDHEMDAMPIAVQRSAVFWYHSAMGARMAAMYGAQVSGRWLIPILGPNPPTEPFPVDLVNAIAAGQIGTLVAIGMPDEVDALEAQFVAAEPRMTELLRRPLPDQSGLVLEVISTLGG